MIRSIVVLFGVLAICLAHPQFRTLKCVTPDGQLRGGNEPARCQLLLKETEDDTGRPVPEGIGCVHEEHIKNGKSEDRVYCDLVCPKAHTVFLAGIEQGHRSCFNFYTYRIERRENEWFLYRSGDCLNSTVTLRIGCKFDEPFNTQFANDNQIIDHLRAFSRRA